MPNDPNPAGQTPAAPERPTKTVPHHEGLKGDPKPDGVDQLPTIGSPEHPSKPIQKPTAK